GARGLGELRGIEPVQGSGDLVDLLLGEGGEAVVLVGGLGGQEGHRSTLLGGDAAPGRCRREPPSSGMRTRSVREVGQSVSMSEVTSRALRLLALLQSRTVWTGPELAAEMGVTTRTVRRDVDRLRQLGYPVLTSAGHGGGYQ